MEQNLFLTDEGLRDRAAFSAADIRLPAFDRAAMRRNTDARPVWVHFGAGNLFRGFIARLQQRLLENGTADSGILAAESYDPAILDDIYVPHDSLSLLVGLRPDGGTEREVIASIADGIHADSGNPAEWARLCAVFRQPSLQLASFTITEKGYALRDMAGRLTPAAQADIDVGPGGVRHAMGIAAALLLTRYRAGGTPLAMVSLDNCSRNGERLREAVLAIADGWAASGQAEPGFAAWLADESRVSFPFSMIDKITPCPAESVAQTLARLGLADMTPIVTARKTAIAPFVNAELPEYLVIEDRFPNGRPPLEQAGVYLTDRATVIAAERMKVTACLNPLHTALAVFGCLLGYRSIAEEMADMELRALVERLGYDEGLPAAADPGILRPTDFLREVIEQRLPNRFLPDTPQRIAADTSQKLPIRFGETLRTWLADDRLNVASLVGIPLVFAGWLRYLLGQDDAGQPMAVSPDPLLDELREPLAGIQPGEPDSAAGRLRPLLSNAALFGTDLYATELGERVEGLFREMLAGPGAVRTTLRRHLGRQL